MSDIILFASQSVIKKEFISVYCRDGRSKNYVFFDGDQKPNSQQLDWRNIPVSEITLGLLKQKIKEQTMEDIDFSVDGGVKGGNQLQKIDLSKKYLDYYLTNVFYLPRNIPEEIIWDDGYASRLIEISIIDVSMSKSLISELALTTSTKSKFAKLTLGLHGINTAEEMMNTHKLFLNYWLQQRNDNYKYVEQVINKIMDSLNS